MKTVFRIVCMAVLLFLLLTMTVFPVSAAAPGQAESPGSVDITPTFIAGLAGLLLSVAFNYIPGLRVKYGGLSEEAKSGIMALSLLGAVGLIALSSCLNLWLWIACTKIGFMQLGEMLIAALVTNQAAYKLSPQMTDVKMAKATRYFPAKQ